jgi:hypothetical protein
MAEAIKDLVAYYNAGTLVSALTGLSQQTALNSQDSAKKVEDLQKNSSVSPDKNVLEALYKLESLLNDFNQSQLAISKLQKIFAELQTDQNFQPMIKENNLSWPSDWKQAIIFLRNIREKASSKPKYSQLLLKIDQTIVNFSQ